MVDFYALCVDLARVADALDGRTPLTSNQGQALDGYSALAEFRHVADRARAALAAEADGPAVSDDREPASVIPHLTQQLYRRAKILFVRKVIDQALRDTASVHWRVADTGEQLVRATDLLAWAEHMEKQMEQLDD